MKDLNRIVKESEFDSKVDYWRYLRGLYRNLRQQKRRVAELLKKEGKLDYVVEK